MQLVSRQSQIMSNSCFIKRTSDFIPNDSGKPLKVFKQECDIIKTKEKNPFAINVEFNIERRD